MDLNERLTPERVVCFDLGAEEQNPAAEHLISLCTSTKIICGEDFLAPAEAIFARAMEEKQEEEVGEKRKLCGEILEMITTIITDGKRQFKHKKAVVGAVAVAGEEIMEVLRAGRHAAPREIVIFRPKTAPMDISTLTESNISAAIAWTKWIAEDKQKIIKAEALIRKSFGEKFRRKLEGREGRAFESIPVTQIMEVFVNDCVLHLENTVIDAIRASIANMGNKVTVVEGADHVTRMYRLLSIGGVEIHTGERRRLLLKAIEERYGTDTKNIVSNLPSRSMALAGRDGGYSFEQLIAAISSVRNAPGTFPDNVQNLNAVQQIRGNSTRNENGTRAPGGGQPINPEWEPKVTDELKKWDLNEICGYHFPNEGRRPRKSHTNGQCLRNKEVFFAKYSVLKAAHEKAANDKKKK